MPDGAADRMSLDELRTTIAQILEAAGVDGADAAVVSDVLATAEFMGVESQGLMRLGKYLDSWFSGAVRSPADPRLVHDAGAALVLDANRSWPQVVVLTAADRAIARARDVGTCSALISGTGHIGRLGHYVEHIAAQGCIGMAMTGGDGGARWVAPWGSRTPLWGTNPIALAFPRPDGPDVVVDISTTQTSRGRILLAQDTGEDLPEGCAFDAAGHPTSDPVKALPPHGSMMPLGGLTSGHKGYGLALAVEILTGVLAGPQPHDAGSTFISVFNPAAFTTNDGYAGRLTELAMQIKTGEPRSGLEIRLPGEGAEARMASNMSQGLALSVAARTELRRTAARVGVSLDHLRGEGRTA